MKKILQATTAFMLFLLCIGTINTMAQEPGHLSKTTTKNQHPKPFIPHLPAILHENSGIILWDSLLWAINDSGGENVVYAFDFSGKIKMEIEVEGATNRDWEEIAQDEKHIYIGDFGNNFSARQDLKIYAIKKADIGNEKQQKVASSSIAFQFGNQTDYSMQRHSGAFDCEAMTAFDNSLLVFTKDWENQATAVYKLPAREGTYTPNPVDSLQVDALITGADISPDGTKLALIGYINFKPILWYFTGITEDHIFGTKRTYLEMDAFQGAQTEGVCFWGNDALLISCEGTPLFEAQVFLLSPLREVDFCH